VKALFLKAILLNWPGIEIHCRPRIADDLDQPVGGVQPSQEIVVLTIGAREEGREVAEPMPRRLSMPWKPCSVCTSCGADAVDQDLVELAHLPPAGHRQGQTSQNGKPK